MCSYMASATTVRYAFSVRQAEVPVLAKLSSGISNSLHFLDLKSEVSSSAPLVNDDGASVPLRAIVAPALIAKWSATLESNRQTHLHRFHRSLRPEMGNSRRSEVTRS
jgi:hypothetical protein